MAEREHSRLREQKASIDLALSLLGLVLWTLY